MKKIIPILFSILCALTLAGCADNSSPNPLPPEPPASSAAPSPAPSESETPGETAQSDTPTPSSEPSSAPVESGTSEENPQQAAPPPAKPAPSPAPAESKPPEQPPEDVAIPTVNIQVGNKSFTATMYDNESARALIQEMPFTLEMDDFAAQEKVAALTFDLPSARTETPARINAGDIYLWSGNNLVLFYTSFSNPYSYVPIGRVTDVSGLRDALGSGSLQVTFSIE